MTDFDDDDDFDRPREIERRPLDDAGRRRIYERACCAILPPAVCFIILGVLGFIYGGYQIYNVQQFDANWDLQTKVQQANPIPAAQKQIQQDMMDTLKGPTKAFTIMSAVLCNIVAVLMIATGILLLKLRAKTFILVGSIVAFLPVTYCCLGGLPVGIWTLVLLGRREVKAGFKLTAQSRAAGKSLTTLSVVEAFGEVDEIDRGYARRRASLPGLFLMLLGLLGIVIGIAWIGVAISHPNFLFDFMKEIANLQPIPAQRDAMLAQYESQKDIYRLDRPLSLASVGVGCLASTLMVIGGLQMRRMRNYSLAMAAAICGVSTFHGCSFFAIPFGIWALIVLSDVDVRRTFDWQARQRGRE